MDMRPSARQQELIEVTRTLAMEKFEPRAAEYDREARFPVEDYVELRDAGFLGLCVPEEFGGLGADLETCRSGDLLSCRRGDRERECVDRAYLQYALPDDADDRRNGRCP